MINLSRSSPHQRWLVPLFFVLLLAMGLLIYQDYGISIDEPVSRNNGLITLKHVALKISPAWVAANPEFGYFQTPLAEYQDRDYGVAFEATVTFLEKLFHLYETRDQYHFRHLCTFLVCWGGLIAFYQLAARRFNDWRIGLLATSWLVVSPRLFADFFYNDKDAVFMALFVISINTGVRMLLRPSAGRIGWHALACALTIDVRIMGVLLPLATFALLTWRGVVKEMNWRQLLTVSMAYAVLTSGLIVLFWPYLWPSPLENFLTAFQNMKTFRWGGTVLYFGENVSSLALPWHYAPVWISITTPILYLGAGLLGIIVVTWQIIQQRWRIWQNEQQLQDVMFLGLFAGPLAAVIVMHSALYDGWRQLYFIYPAFLLLAVRGWVAVSQSISNRARWSRLLYGATALSLLVTAAQMVRDHPYQNVYFNWLVGPHVMQRFELDYWGLGYQEDLVYIAAHDPRQYINVYSPAPTPAYIARLMLPDKDRERLIMVDAPEKADYVITSYRGHPQPYPYPNEVYQIRADGRLIHSVFKLR